MFSCLNSNTILSGTFAYLSIPVKSIILDIIKKCETIALITLWKELIGTTGSFLTTFYLLMILHDRHNHSVTVEYTSQNKKSKSGLTFGIFYLWTISH